MRSICHNIIDCLALGVGDKGETFGEAGARIPRHDAVNNFTKLRKVRLDHVFSRVTLLLNAYFCERKKFAPIASYGRNVAL